jgi:tRNA (cytidine/uridine-2'-O-)-methyltransferase
MEDRQLRRAGLDYREWARVQEHADLDAFVAAVAPPRLLALTTRGARPHHQVRYASGDALLFGPESRGLPARLLDALPEANRVRIPMVPGSRSLNLSNAVAVVVYEAWRQHGYAGGA